MVKITKDMLKDIKPRDFTLNQHDIVVDGEVKTHWDIRVEGRNSEWSLVDDPTTTESTMVIERKLRPVPKGIESNIVNIDSGLINIIDSEEGTTMIFGGEKLQGIWKMYKDDSCVIPKSAIFKKES